MIEEFPPKLELLSDVSSEGFHSERLGRVVTGINHVETEFFCRGVTPMRSFARDESVHATAGNFGHLAAGATRHDTDLLHCFWTSRAGHHSRTAHRRFHATLQFFARHGQFSADTD